MLKDFFNKARGQNSSKDELPSDSGSPVTSGIQNQETGLSPALQTIGRSGLKARGLARSIAAHHPARRSPVVFRKLNPAVPLVVQKMAANVRRHSIPGLSRAGSYLRRAVGTVLHRAPLGLSRWKSYPAYRTLEGFSPTWLKPRRARQTPFDDQVGASNDSATPAYTWPSQRIAQSAASSDRRRPARMTGMSSAARVRNIPISPTSSHIARAISRPLPQVRKPAIIVSREVSAWIDDPIKSGLERPIAEKSSGPVVSPDRWTPREYGSAPKQDQTSPAAPIDNLGSESTPNSLNLRAVQREGMEPGTGSLTPVYSTTSRDTPTGLLRRAVSPRTAASSEMATTASRPSEQSTSGAKDSQSTERRDSRVGLLQRSRRLLSKAKKQPSEKNRKTIATAPQPSSPTASDQASQVRAHVDNPREINANLGIKDEAHVGHLNQNGIPASKPESQLAADRSAEEAAPVSDTQAAPTTGIIGRTRRIVGLTSNLVFRKSAVITRGSDAQAPLQQPSSGSRSGLLPAHEPMQAQSRHHIEISTSTSKSSVSRQPDAVANPPNAQESDRAEPQLKKHPQAQRTANIESAGDKISAKSLQKRPLRSDSKDTTSHDSAKTGLPTTRETSHHLVGQMPPTSGIVQRSRKLAARTRDLVFRKPPVVVRDSNAQALPQQPSSTAGSSLRSTREPSPVQNHNRTETPASASKPSVSEKVNQSVGTPDAHHTIQRAGAVAGIVRGSRKLAARSKILLSRKKPNRTDLESPAQEYESDANPIPLETGEETQEGFDLGRGDASPRLIQRLQPASGIVDRSLSIVTRTRNLVFRKLSSTAITGVLVNSDHRQDNTARSHVRQSESALPSQTSDSAASRASKPAPSTSAELGQASAVPDKQKALRDREPEGKSSRATRVPYSVDTSRPRIAATPGDGDKPVMKTLVRRNPILQIVRRLVAPSRTLGRATHRRVNQAKPFAGAIQRSRELASDARSLVFRRLSPERTTSMSPVASAQEMRLQSEPSTRSHSTETPVRSRRPIRSQIRRIRGFIGRKSSPSGQAQRLLDETHVPRTLVDSTFSPWHQKNTTAGSGLRRTEQIQFGPRSDAADSKSSGFQSEVTEKAPISPTYSGTPDADRAELTLRKQDDKTALNPVARSSESDNGTLRAASTGNIQSPASPHPMTGPGNSESVVASPIPIKPVRGFKPLATRSMMIHRRLKPLGETERRTMSRRSRRTPALRKIVSVNRTPERRDSSEAIDQRRPLSFSQANSSISITRVASLKDGGGLQQPELTGSRQNGNNLLDLLNSGRSQADSRSKSLPLATRMYRVPTRDMPGVRSHNSVGREFGSFPKASANGVAQRQPASARPSPSVHKEPVYESVLVNGSTDGGNAIRRVSESPESVSQPSGGEQKREFSGEEIEFLAPKIYNYIKNRMAIERERHGRPGFSVWR